MKDWLRAYWSTDPGWLSPRSPRSPVDQLQPALADVGAHQAGAGRPAVSVGVDGLIYGALHGAARRARRAHRARLARWLLAAGSRRRLFANVAPALRYGVARRAWSALARAALVGWYELLMLERPVWRRRPVPAVPGPDTDLAGLNGHAHAAAELFAADIEAGRVPGIRAIRSGLHVGQDKAGQVQAYLRTITRTP